MEGDLRNARMLASWPRSCVKTLRAMRRAFQFALGHYYGRQSIDKRCREHEIATSKADAFAEEWGSDLEECIKSSLPAEIDNDATREIVSQQIAKAGEAGITVSRLDTALDSLEEEQHLYLVLHARDGMTCLQIAETLRVDIDRVKKQTAAAYARLRITLLPLETSFGIPSSNECGASTDRGAIVH